MLALHTLGGLSVARDGATITGAGARRRPLALLAILACAGERGISRSALAARLWPESDDVRSRNVLSQTLYGLRRDLDCDDLVLDEPELRLNPARIAADVTAFRAALAVGDPETAVALYAGPFLDGFHLPNAEEFEPWMETERAALAHAAEGALESVALARTQRGELAGAIVAWRRLATMIPLNGRVALGLMDALVQAGDVGGALQAASVHEALTRDELGAPLDARVRARVDALRRGEMSSPPHTGSATPIATTSFAAPPVEAPIVAPSVAPRVDAARPIERRATSLRRLAFGAALLTAMAAVAAVTGVALRFRGTNAAPRATSPDRGAIAVLPFRVAGAAPSLAYLREGMMDLLAAGLTGERGPHAADPRTVLAALRHAPSSAGAVADDAVTREEAMNVARSVGADRMLSGSVVGSATRVELRASLARAVDGVVVAAAAVSGPPDSLASLVDGLLVQLLAGSVSDDPTQYAALGAHPLVALRAYVDGQAAYRRGEYAVAVAAFSQVLDADSTFGLAAIQLYTAGYWVAGANLAPFERGLRIAFAQRDRLPARDRAAVLAWAGPRYPAVRRASLSEDRIDWERAVALAPGRAEYWYELGDNIFHGATLLGGADGAAQSAAAFRRALALDSTFAPPLVHLLESAAIAGDSSQVRTLLRIVEARSAGGDLDDFLRWRAAVALGDAKALETSRARLRSASTSSLERLIGAAQLDGVALDDADRAAAILRARGGTANERWEIAWTLHALALNRGRPSEARDALRTLSDVGTSAIVVDRLALLDELYAQGDHQAGSAALAHLMRVTYTTMPDASVTLGERGIADCTLGLWRLAHGELDAVSRAVASLRAARQPVLDSMHVTIDQPLCAALLDAGWRVATRAPDARASLERADALSREGRRQFPMLGSNEMNLELARLWEQVGDRPAALAALRRRAYHWTAAMNLATYLREEARLATLTGDHAGAARATDHYRALRGEHQ